MALFYNISTDNFFFQRHAVRITRINQCAYQYRMKKKMDKMCSCNTKDT